MVARLEKQRRARRNILFDDAVRIGDADFRGLLPAVAPAFEPSEVLALAIDQDHEVYFVPDRVAVTQGSNIDDLLRAGKFNSEGLKRISAPEGAGSDYSSTNVYTLQPTSPRGSSQAAADTIRWIAELSRRDDRASGESSLSPVYGFSASQYRLGAGDPEMGPALAIPANDQGEKVSIAILDTGLDDEWAWRPALGSYTGDAEVLVGPTPPYLGDGSGHGTFIAGLIAQMASKATVHVTRIINSSGFTDEQTLANALMGLLAAPPDIVVISCGGYAVSLGAFGTAPGPSWMQPLVLRDAVQNFVRSAPRSVVVMSAGNDDSNEPMFPAAFAATLKHDYQLVSVGALDDDGWRAQFSNFGQYVTCSALGVRLHSTFVAGPEDPAADPDGHPENWTPQPFAQWSGTSFSGPLVAGRIAQVLAALTTANVDAHASLAWKVVALAATTCTETECGLHILTDGVAHA
jgi:hypothetical protein